MSEVVEKVQKDYAEYIVSNEEFEPRKKTPLKPSTDRFRQVELVRKKEDEEDDEDYVRIELSPIGRKFGRQVDLFVHTGFHPSIVQFEGYEIYPNHRAVTKYYSNGSLEHLLKSKKKPAQWNGTMKSICVFGLISAVTHIHNVNDERVEDFTIRYLCPENIIFDTDNHPRLIHYVFGNEKLGKTKNAYIPPELHKDPEAKRFNEDSWAIGMILYEIVTGHEPYKGKDEDEIKDLIESGELPEFPEESEDTDHIIGIIQNCLDKNPTNRPLPYMIYHHLINTADFLFPDTDQVVYDNYKNKVSEYMYESDEYKSYKDYIDGSDKPSKEDLFERAEEGDPDALVRVGRIYQKGNDDIEKDEEKSFKYYLKAAKKDYPIGMFNASVCLMKGIGCDQNLKESFKWMKKASELGLERAVAEYGKMLLDGKGTRKDVEKAIEVFQEGADKNYSKCQYQLGTLYFDGCPPQLKKNQKKAIQLFEKAASLGYAQANCDIAYYYYQQGKDDDDDESMKKAINLFKKAARQKSTDALINLGKIYKAGKFAEKDLEYAANCFKKASELKSTEGTLQYAVCLNGGFGIDKDVKTAAKLFRQVADKGNKTAQYNYAKLLYDGKNGVKKDVETAVEYFKMAADQDVAVSMFYYAKILINGEGGVDKNKTEGEKYLKRYTKKVPKDDWLPETKKLLKAVGESDDESDDDDDEED